MTRGEDAIEIVRAKWLGTPLGAQLSNVKVSAVKLVPGTGYLVCVTGDVPESSKRRTVTTNTYLIAVNEGLFKIVQNDLADCSNAAYEPLTPNTVTDRSGIGR